MVTNSHHCHRCMESQVEQNNKPKEIKKICRKDRYNAKLYKYYVVYGEDDESVSEDEERKEHEEVGEASRSVLFPQSSWPSPLLLTSGCSTFGAQDDWPGSL